MPVNERFQPPPRSWPAKIRDAVRGVGRGLRGQSSFLVHTAASVAVVGAGTVLSISHTEWLAVVLCITLVWTAEMFNVALEAMAKAVDHRHNEHLGTSLDIAAGAVLLSSIGAVAIGAMVFLPRLWLLLAR